jgi:hypothetical protein
MYITRSISSDTPKNITTNRIQDSKATKYDSASYTNKTPERILLPTKTLAVTNKDSVEHNKIEILLPQDTVSNDAPPTTLKATESDVVIQEYKVTSSATDSVSIPKDHTEKSSLNPSEAKTNVSKTSTKSSSKKKNKFSLKPAKAFNVDNPNF